MPHRHAAFALVFAALLPGALGALLAPATAQAQTSDQEAERYRLTEDMRRLAQRNAWVGVEARYADLLALRIPLPVDTHLLGAQSAGYLGKTWQVYRRLERANEVDPDPELQQEMAALDGRYGRVRIEGSARWELPLSRPAMPFGPDERKSVEYAIMVAKESGGFEGMLPAGDYVLGTDESNERLEFTVAPGPEWQVVEATRGMVAGTAGLIVYSGPTATGGYNFIATPEPGERIDDRAGTAQGSPLSSAGSGMQVEVGYEVGFTRAFAVGASFEYRNLIVGHGQFHGYTGWLATYLRPGDLRVGVGPIYGRWAGQGSGVAGWFPHSDPAEVFFDGQSWAGGVKASAGYGLLDLDPFQGLVELTGTWQTDGARSFSGLGLRVGIVPKVPRFRE